MSQEHERELEKAVSEAAKYGAVRATLYFDAHSKDEQAVKASLVDFVGRLAIQQGVLYCKGEVLETMRREPDEHSKEPEFTSSAKVDMVAVNFSTLQNVCLRFAPMAVDIVTPGSIKLSGEEAQAVLLDASRAAQDFAETIYRKLMTPEDYAKLSKDLTERIEAGKQALEKAKQADKK